jgi:hypothetical protein
MYAALNSDPSDPNVMIKLDIFYAFAPLKKGTRDACKER